jgi:hypothetical protein
MQLQSAVPPPTNATTTRRRLQLCNDSAAPVARSTGIFATMMQRMARCWSSNFTAALQGWAHLSLQLCNTRATVPGDGFVGSNPLDCVEKKKAKSTLCSGLDYVINAEKRNTFCTFQQKLSVLFNS